MGQLHGRAGLDVVQRRAGGVHVESRAGWGPAVGVDAHYRGGLHRVGHGRAFIYARTDPVVAIPRQLGVNAHSVERAADQLDDGPIERVLRVAAVGGGARGVARLGASPTVVAL